jgi:[protein-PII] uridylyltransferase
MLKAAEDNLDLNKIVDPAKLRKALNAIAAKHGGASNEARMEVLAEVKRVNALGRETARTMLFEDGGGTACAMRISSSTGRHHRRALRLRQHPCLQGRETRRNPSA